MTWIKICGITNLADALTAVDAGADALGFVFYEKSPRNVTPETVREIAARLPSTIEKVGVFVLDAAADVMEKAESSGLTAVQLQIRATPGAAHISSQPLTAVASGKRVKFYLAVPAMWFGGNGTVEANLESFVALRPERTFDTVFLDAATPDLAGGTGKTFDWENASRVVEEMKKTLKIVVAGGLTSDNVTEAIRILTPWGVDVASGVEAAPGKKDPAKVRAFVQAVRKMERN